MVRSSLFLWLPSIILCQSCVFFPVKYIGFCTDRTLQVQYSNFMLAVIDNKVSFVFPKLKPPTELYQHDNDPTAWRTSSCLSAKGRLSKTITCLLKTDETDTSLLDLQEVISLSFNLEHINILFHAFSACSSGLLCPFTYLCFHPGHILIHNRQFCFDSYFYVKCGGGGRRVGVPCHCFCTLLFAETAFFSPHPSPSHNSPKTSSQWIKCYSNTFSEL